MRCWNASLPSGRRSPLTPTFKPRSMMMKIQMMQMKKTTKIKMRKTKRLMGTKIVRKKMRLSKPQKSQIT